MTHPSRALNWLRAARVALLCGAVAALAACGGGGGDAAAPAAAPLGPGESAYDDPASYSSTADASLPGAEEGAAVTRHSIVLAGTRIAYTARAGHLIARHSVSNAAQASVFYVAYTAEGANAATRPVSFFYNGGPGSASVWLHLGSFGPQRLATSVPATDTPRPFALVANDESLLDTTDLVFVNAVGTGLSQAIAPFTNRSFWGVDADAALFRDFINRWLAVNGRSASPKFLYGESYGGPRTAVLARLLQDAGVALDGLVLQSPALDYNSNCGVIGSGSCYANLPTYAAIGAWHRLTVPVEPDTGLQMDQARSFAQGAYAPAVSAFLLGTPPLAGLLATLQARTGVAVATWQQQFNLSPDIFASNLIPGSIVGRYDGRIAAVRGTPLASEGDPSSTLIGASFSAAIDRTLRDTLRYTNASTYVLLGSAIQHWNFAHAGRALPDTVPDLVAALAQNPRLRVLAASGWHDLATPFHVTELDLARLGTEPRLRVRNYAGGHMTFLDDAARVRQKADLVAFYAEALAARASSAARALAAAPASAARALSAAPAVAPATLPDRAGTPPATPPATPQPALREQPLQTPHLDPWAPPAQVQQARRERAAAAPR